MTPNHNFKEPFRRVLQPFSPDQPLDITITCNGGIGNYHHSGLRPYTNREFASLSGFPVIHYFGDVGEIRLIGNAVPPPVSEALTRTLIEALEKEDGFEGRSARRRRQKSFVEPPVRGRSSGSVPHTPVRKSSVRPIDLTLGEPPVISPWRQSPVHRIRPLQAESSTFPPTPQSTHSFPTLADRSRSSGHSDRPIDLVTDDRPSSSPFRQLIQQRRNGTQGTGVIPFPSTPRNIRNASSWVDDSPSAGRSLRGRGSATKRKLSIIEVDD